MGTAEFVKASFLFDGIIGNILPEEMVKTIRSFLVTENLYYSATREIAMDFWASLEHELAYNLGGKKKASVSTELKACADEIADIDKRRQNLYNISIEKKTKSTLF